MIHSEQRTVAPPLIQSSFSRRISWGALFAGVVVAVTVQMLLTVLGVGVGAATLDAQNRPTAGLGIGAGIWFALSGIIAFYFAGWTAGRLAGIPRRVESAMHGFLTWGLGMVIGSMLVTSAFTGILGSATQMLGQAGGSAAAGAAAGASNDGGNAVQDSLSNATDRAREAIQDQGGAEGVAQQAQQATQQAAKPVAGASLAGFFVLLLAAAASTLGGLFSTPKNTILTSLPAWERRGARG